MKHLAILVALALLATTADACITRHRSAKVEFARAHACPSTGLAKLPCPGYVIDHVIPLCAHGKDARSNMQWQTIAEGKAKDVLERKECRKFHQPRPSRTSEGDRRWVQFAQSSPAIPSSSTPAAAPPST